MVAVAFEVLNALLCEKNLVDAGSDFSPSVVPEIGTIVSNFSWSSQFN